MLWSTKQPTLIDAVHERWRAGASSLLPLHQIQLRSYTQPIHVLGDEPPVLHIETYTPHSWPEAACCARLELLEGAHMRLTLTKEGTSQACDWYASPTLESCIEPLIAQIKGFVLLAD